MKYLFSIFVCMMIMFFLMACTTDHSFKLDEKRQIIVVHNLIRLYIESEDSSNGDNQMFFVCKKNEHGTKKIDILYLQDKSPNLSVNKMNDHGIYKEIHIIDLLPNRKYTIIHRGMGGRVRIQEFFWTDSLGNLRVDPTRKRIVGYKDLRGA